MTRTCGCSMGSTRASVRVTRSSSCRPWPAAARSSRFGGKARPPVGVPRSRSQTTTEREPQTMRNALARRPRRLLAASIAAALVLATAGMAIAKSFTLNVAKNATVTNMTAHKTKHEAIVVNGKGFAVYWLTGDSKSHPECTKANECFSFWPPVTAALAKSLSKTSGIKGKLTTWSRNGFVQAVLNGHPLYTFAPDTKRDD